MEETPELEAHVSGRLARRRAVHTTGHSPLHDMRQVVLRRARRGRRVARVHEGRGRRGWGGVGPPDIAEALGVPRASIAYDTARGTNAMALENEIIKEHIGVASVVA
jgi:hypothetical protein